MAYGTAEECSCLLEGADAWQYLDLNLIRDSLLAHHLVDEGGHTIDTRIARGDDAYSLPFEGIAEGLFGTLTLSLHTAVDTQRIGTKVLLNKAEVILIADDDVRSLYGLEYGWGNIFGAARADASDDNLILVHLKENA